MFEAEHVPLVNPNTGHSIVWTEASQKPVNPCWEIAEDKDVEETKGGEVTLHFFSKLLGPHHKIFIGSL